MSTRKTIGWALGAIIVLLVAQILAQLVASLFVLVKIPEGICNIIAGIIYVGLAFVLIELFSNQRIIAGNAQFTGIAAGRGVRFTTGLLLLGKGLGMRETPIRPHS